jgi:hypothetical protein
MNVLLLLPGCISLLLVIRGRIETAFLSVYLPALLLLPETYAVRLPHCPPISAAEFALIPIGFVAVYRLIVRGPHSPMDILVGLFIVSLWVSEILKEPILNDGIFQAATYTISIFLAYAAGRRLIEPGLRLAAVQRFVLLVLLLGLPGLLEWRLGQNYYGVWGQKLFQIALTQGVQLRGGHARISASFTDAEILGIALGMTFALNAWLVYLYKTRPETAGGGIFPRMEKRHIPGILLLLYILLTQSRGPLLGLGAAFLILQIPRFKNTKRATVFVAVAIALSAIAVHQYLNYYTNISGRSVVVDEQLGSAMYRKAMNEFYAPIAEQGGWLGYGILHHPSLPGLESIDNEFLRVHLDQGRFGYLLFILIALESARSLVVRSWRIRTIEDSSFALCMLGAMAVFWVTLMTVYMGEQLPQVGFLLVGWGQSIVAGSPAAAQESEPTASPKFSFRRVFG